MTDDRRYEGEYPGQEGLPFDEGAGRDAGGRRSPGGSPDDDLFVWDELRPPDRGRDGRGRRPADAEPDGWQVRESPEGAERPRAPRDDRRASGDWRAPEYPTGAGRARHEPADGYEVSEEWEEWLEPERAR